MSHVTEVLTKHEAKRKKAVWGRDYALLALIPCTNAYFTYYKQGIINYLNVYMVKKSQTIWEYIDHYTNVCNSAYLVKSVRST